MAAFAARLLDAWALRPPDVAHAHFWMSGTAAMVAGRRLGIPVVQTFHALGVVKRRHQGDRDTSPPQRLQAETRLATEVDHIVATCSDEVFELARLGAELDRISVVPCGVDLSLFCPEGSAEPRGRWPHRVVAVGRLVERKGLDTLVAALAMLPGTELVAAGGPARSGLVADREAQRLLAFARRVGVAERVQLRGRVEQALLPSLLRSADAVVCVPWYEPFGIVPLEAMACAVPVVASAVGGLVDTVLDGVTGVHVPPKRPDALARALRSLLADPARRARMGAAGARRARTRYSWTRVAASTLDAYQQVVPNSLLAGAMERR
jgi:glycosyltransferase involved in cell wall biosynthesis